MTKASLRNMKTVPEKTYDKKITVTLNSDTIRFLKGFSENLRENGGYYLGMSAIIRALIEVIKELDINIEGIKSQEELINRILSSIKFSK